MIMSFGGTVSWLTHQNTNIYVKLLNKLLSHYSITVTRCWPGAAGGQQGQQKSIKLKIYYYDYWYIFIKENKLIATRKRQSWEKAETKLNLFAY